MTLAANETVSAQTQPLAHRLKVLHVTPTFHPDVGGLETMIDQLTGYPR
jgi:hypothetical protein